MLQIMTERKEIMRLLQIKDESEFLRILEALEVKLGGLVEYENILIKEAEILKKMYEEVYISAKKTEELLEKFEKQELWFFSSFDGRIGGAIESTLKSLLEEYNIVTVNLSKGEPNE